MGQGTFGEEVPEIKVTEEEKKQTPVRKTRKSMMNSPAPPTPAENQFDGGFFQITSPARTSPAQSPKTKTPGSGEKSRRSVGGDHLRRAVLNDSTRRSISGLILSPFLSQVSRRSLPGPNSPLRSTSPSSPVTGTLVDIVDPVVPLSSPVTKTYSKTGVSPAAKQR